MTMLSTLRSRRHPGVAAPSAQPVPVANALARLLDGVEPVVPNNLPPASALGLVLAAPIVAPGAIPPERIALRAGWTVSSAETVGASSYSPARLSGATLVGPGDALPADCDAVVPADAVVAGPGGTLDAMETAAPGQWTRAPGEDVRAGQVLKGAGERVSALDAATIEAAGLATVSVRRPLLRLLVIGPDMPDTAACLGLIRALAIRWGALVEAAEPESLALAATGADLLVAIGTEAALGRHLHEISAEIVARSLALRPGEATALARLGPVPLVAIPGRLADALGAALAILRPAIVRLSGTAPVPMTSHPLTRKLVSAIGLTEVALLKTVSEGWEPLGTGDLTFAAMASADGFVLVPPGAEGYPAGSRLPAEPL